MEHLHAVGQHRVSIGVHGLATTSAAQMSEPCARKHATGRIVRMIHRGKQPPFRAPGVYGVIVDCLGLSPLACHLAEFRVCANGDMSQFVNGGAGVQKA